MPEPGRVIFVPGVSGDGRFWGPVADRLPDRDTILLDLPGCGNVPHSPSVQAFDDLVAVVLRHMDRPVDLVAQSMGGVVAVNAVLERPDAVRRLVLTATSGGIPLGPFAPRDWRDEYRREYPGAARWVTEYRVDLTDRIATIRQPTLLLWTDGDPISPVGVGERLAALLPDARLVVVPGGDHAFARDRAADVAPHIARHLDG